MEKEKYLRESLCLKGWRKTTFHRADWVNIQYIPNINSEMNIPIHAYLPVLGIQIILYAHIETIPRNIVKEINLKAVLPFASLVSNKRTAAASSPCPFIFSLFDFSVYSTICFLFTLRESYHVTRHNLSLTTGTIQYCISQSQLNYARMGQKGIHWISNQSREERWILKVYH